jgi:hypothetical protein
VLVRTDRRVVVLGLACVVVPLLVYAISLDSQWQRFGLSAATGWFLYGRTAQIARCDHLKLSAQELGVCRATQAQVKRDPSLGPGYYMWTAGSPANLTFGARRPDAATQKQSDGALEQIAEQVIENRPWAYLSVVASDFLRFFAPGAGSPGGSDTAIDLPDRPLAAPPDFQQDIRDQLLPRYRSPARFPARLLHGYQRVIGTPRLSLGALVLLSLAALAAALSKSLRPRLRHTREILLLSGTGVAMLLAAVAVSGFVVRYMLPAVPLILAGGSLALLDLLRLRSAVAAGEVRGAVGVSTAAGVAR